MRPTVVVRNASSAGSVADDGAEVARAGGYLQEARSEAARLAREYDDTQLDVEAIFNTIDDTPRTVDSGFQPRTMSEGDFDTGFDLPAPERHRRAAAPRRPPSGIGESTVDNTVLTATDIPSTRSADPPTQVDDTVEDLDLYVDPVENVGAAQRAAAPGGDFVSVFHGAIRNGPTNVRTASTRTRGRSSCRAISRQRRTRSITTPTRFPVSRARSWRRAFRVTCSKRSSFNSNGPTAASIPDIPGGLDRDHGAHARSHQDRERRTWCDDERTTPTDRRTRTLQRGGRRVRPRRGPHRRALAARLRRAGLADRGRRRARRASTPTRRASTSCSRAATRG